MVRINNAGSNTLYQSVPACVGEVCSIFEKPMHNAKVPSLGFEVPKLSRNTIPSENQDRSGLKRALGRGRLIFSKMPGSGLESLCVLAAMMGCLGQLWPRLLSMRAEGSYGSTNPQVFIDRCLTICRDNRTGVASSTVLAIVEYLLGRTAAERRDQRGSEEHFRRGLEILSLGSMAGACVDVVEQNTRQRTFWCLRIGLQGRPWGTAGVNAKYRFLFPTDIDDFVSSARNTIAQPAEEVSIITGFSKIATLVSFREEHSSCQSCEHYLTELPEAELLADLKQPAKADMSQLGY